VRRGIVILFALTLGLALLTGASTASADTTVSLTFDDGNADQMPAVQMLDDHGMEGTFYIITNRVGRPDGYMTWSQVQTIYDHGNEIGGHTRDHIHLNDSDYTNAEIQNQICGGRQDLLARGYPQVSFAYPFGDHDARSEGYVQSCGYLSGRGVSGLQQEDGEPDAESIPPSNPWVVHTRGSIDVEDTLPEVEDWIAKAEAFDDDNGPADAWIPLVFHHLCDPDVSDCSDSDGVDDQYMTPQDFDSLLDWLQARALIGTNVKTVEEVMTGSPAQDTTSPVSSIKCNATSCSSGFYNAPVSATLSATDNSGGSGVKNIRYTTNGSNPTSSSPVYSAAIPVNSTTTIKWRAEDNAGNVESPVRSQLISIDTAKPTSAIQCDGAACVPAYDHSVSATLSGNDTGGAGLKNIRYTTNGSDPTSSSPVYTAAIPVNSTTTIKWRAEDNAGNVESPVHSQTITISIDTAKPTSAILCDGAPCQASYDHPVEATLSATDTGGSGLKNIRYTTDGSTPTGSSPLYSSPINVDTTTTIMWRAEDNAGNVESPVNSRTIEITSTPPSPGGGDGGAPGSTGGTLGAFASSKSLPNGTVRLTLEVTGPGELEAVDASVSGTAAAAARKKRAAKIKRASKTVTQAGEVTMVIRTSKAGKRILRRKGKLSVPVRVTFTPVSGSPASQTLKVKFRITLKW
jgi:peptidoglycan/xylan/chitin deacetylase (PgdA/CDA1 family)